jgi:broad specificity phosphatase PhoE
VATSPSGPIHDRLREWPLQFAVAAIALWLLVAPTVATAQGALFLVRHAERADTTEDSPLSAAGHARAARLALILRDAGITRIYTTSRRRTVQTAAPLAAALNLTPSELPAADLDALITGLRTATPDDRVLVVGHSNTLPEILQRLGLTAPVTIADAEYDNLFIAIPREGSPPLLVQLRY